MSVDASRTWDRFPVRNPLRATVAALSLICSLTVSSAAAAFPVVMVAGDIACSPSSPKTPQQCRHKETSDLIVARAPDKVLTTGDNQYESGGLRAFRRSYDRTWGRFKEKTRPSPGNHEYDTPDAAGYFEYFGWRAGPQRRGYYSFNVGKWHLVALNSEIATDPSSAQVEWLRDDLAANESRCTLAYWHSPLFSSGAHGNDSSVQPLWQELYAARADIVVNGHDHDYERFARLEPDGQRNRRRGIREFVVGTGGKGLRRFEDVKRHSLARNSRTFGVLKLTLRPAAYRWRFVPEPGKRFTDGGATRCH